MITLWRGQINEEPPSNDPVICRLTYGKETRKSNPSNNSQGLVWKETFVFPYLKKSSFRLDFIKVQAGEEIHFAGEEAMDGLSFGHCIIEMEMSLKGTIPAKQ